MHKKNAEKKKKSTENIFFFITNKRFLINLKLN